MKHLVIGASGQIGGYLFRALADAGEDVEGTYHSQATAKREVAQRTFLRGMSIHP